MPLQMELESNHLDTVKWEAVAPVARVILLQPTSQASCSLLLILFQILVPIPQNQLHPLHLPTPQGPGTLTQLSPTQSQAPLVSTQPQRPSLWMR